MTTRNAASMLDYGTTWECRGYSGAGLVGDLIDSLHGRPAVVCGNAELVFYELEEALRKLGNEAVIFAVNDVGMFLPKLDHWVSLHSVNLGTWKAVRWMHARPREDTHYHAVDEHSFVDYNWGSLRPLFSLSGYFAMQIAYIMGASPIVLCGCPGSPMPRFFEANARLDHGYGGGSASGDKGIRDQVAHEMKRLPLFKAAVRSMGGWTQEFFGRL